MKKLFLLLGISALLFSCKDKKETSTSGEVTADTLNVNKPIEAPVSDPAKDDADIRTTIKDFYTWYAKNYQSLMGFKLYSSTKKNDMPPYKINWDEVKKLQAYIRSSVPQLGEEFLVNQKYFLAEADSAFKVDVKDEIPYGFDYDWYTNTQEDPEYTLTEINKSKDWLITINGDKAIVDIKGETASVLKLAMAKENGVWKIAKIGLQ